MTRKDHLLCCLSEECAEVAQRCSKIMRFGWKEKQPGNDKDNTERLELEIADLLGIIRILRTEGLIWIDEDFVIAKKARFEEYLEYSKQQGTLDA